ncbi:helix-turn-helix domain-containing protein [Algihabitans albus]|uniref:helix-turn-helix domain-containing protein n=1 Tax=Algihabitans albus TaxID=2164067 RepID=UPI000E5D21FA|nr:helix-turn-helix transcriptional regulator [Algihabitans albus]
MADTRDSAAWAPHPVDAYVGHRLRQRRVAVGLTQDKLAKSVGITFQQVQKYERGTNRIVASRLYELAQVLRVSVDYFFKDFEIEAGRPSDASAADQGEAGFSDVMGERETLSLVRAFHRIGNGIVRRRLAELIRSLGESNRNLC